ncbi:malic enzyme domain protein [Ancylostoma ceylanicum]|uniref:Malic enzyme domain protein n=1 Tax=Ancylostoma ceylanicum TaxID=53326 RepID=A0A0D6LTW6_9BILA|nr:malic enzyme domain protein [Ancylostoma ceylanicum]
MGFSLYERQFLGLHGLLPPTFMTIEQQAYRVMSKLRQQPNDLAKYIQMDSLQDVNEKLFYRVICDNVKELMRIVYTPTVGLACQKYGFIYRNPKGLYITIHDNSVSKIYQILSNWPHKDIQAIVVTDGERILGLGDLGAYGMGIPVGKLALYVALAGLHPGQCLPVLLDVGTDNKVRFGRDTLIQFEDFGNLNAYRLLDKYKDAYCMFNDDIQGIAADSKCTGTAAVVVAGLLTTMRVTKKKLCEQRILFFGAGGANTGVAEMCIRQMVEEGMSEEEACEKIFMFDIDGLITKNRVPSLMPRHKRFAKDLPDTKNLYEVVKMVRPHALIGMLKHFGQCDSGHQMSSFSYSDDASFV